MVLASRPEDRPKIAILSILIVAVLAYFFVVVLPQLTGLRRGTPASSSTPPSSAVATQPAATPGAASPGVSVAAPESASRYAAALAYNGGPIPSAPRDPFRPPFAIVPAGNGGIPARPGSNAFAPRPVGGTAGPRYIPLQTLPPFGAAPPVLATRPALVSPPPKPVVTLKGVIKGNPAVAVLQVGDRVVHAEARQKLTSNLTVIEINEDAVVLRDGARRLSLPIGKSLNAPQSSPGRVALETGDVDYTPVAAFVPTPAEPAASLPTQVSNARTDEEAYVVEEAPPLPGPEEADAPSPALTRMASAGAGPGAPAAQAKTTARRTVRHRRSVRRAHSSRRSIAARHRRARRASLRRAAALYRARHRASQSRVARSSSHVRHRYLRGHRIARYRLVRHRRHIVRRSLRRAPATSAISMRKQARR